MRSFTNGKTKEAWHPTESLKGAGPRCLGRQEVPVTLLSCLGIFSNRTGAWTLSGSCDTSRTSHLVPTPNPIREPILRLLTSHFALCDSREQASSLYQGELYGNNMEISSNSQITKHTDCIKNYMPSCVLRDSYKCEALPPGTYPTTPTPGREKQRRYCQLPSPPLTEALLLLTGC